MQLMLAEESYYQQEEEELERQENLNWVHSDQHEEPSGSVAYQGQPGQQEYLGEHPFDGAMGQAIEQGEWGKDSLKMGAISQPVEPVEVILHIYIA